MQKASKWAYLERKTKSRPMHFQKEEQPAARDLNVFAVSFDKTKQAEKNIGTGDPFICTSCQACLNKKSKLYNKADYQKAFLNKPLSSIAEEKSVLASNMEVEKPLNEEKLPSNIEVEKPIEKKSQAPAQKIPTKVVELGNNDTAWVCEFCGGHNKIRIEKEEVPTVEDLVYIIESASNKELKESKNESTIVFCIDNSGSMNITQEVKGKVNLKHGVSQAEIDFLKQFMEPGDEAQLNYIPGQSSGVTYVSRKQCVLAAIENQVNQIKASDPNKRVGLITFNNEVVVFGDCKHDPFHIMGDKLLKYNAIVEDLKPLKVEQPLKASYQQIIHNLDKTEAFGATALGPAVIAAIELASKGSPGSTVFICTDGLANVGLGSLDSSKDTSKEFYGQLAAVAKAHNISVNVTTIKGEACDVQSLSQLARETNGNVLVVSPDDISKKFANILKDQIVALNAVVKIQLHKSLRFRNELPQNLKEDGLILEKEVGNATVNTRVSFEYELRDDEELQKLGVDPEALKELPFQAQITYTSLSGHRLLRVITSSMQTTTNKHLVNQQVHLPVVHTRIAQQSAAYEKAGNVSKMQGYNRGWMDYISKEVEMKESQKVHNQKFSRANDKAQVAYVNKAQKKTQEKPVVKKEEEDMEEDMMLRFEQGKNLDLD